MVTVMHLNNALYMQSGLFDKYV